MLRCIFRYNGKATYATPAHSTAGSMTLLLFMLASIALGYRDDNEEVRAVGELEALRT